VFFIL